MKEEFLEIIRKNERLILKVCNTYCNKLEDQEDLYQDIIIQLWKSFPKFNNRSLVSTWMYRVALNTAITRYRRISKKPQKVPLNDTLITIDYDDSIDEGIKLLRKAMESLNPIEKAIITLYLEKLKYKEIGEIMNLSESNIGFKINTIKKKLKKILSKNGH